MTKLNKKTIKAIIRRIKAGETQRSILEEMDISYKSWRKGLVEHEIDWKIARGQPPTTYSMEVLREVQRRARAGEFIQDICEELGLLYPNMCRACRRKGIRILDKASLRANIKRRKSSTPRRKPGEPIKNIAIFAAIKEGAGVEELMERFDIGISYAKLCRKDYRDGTAKKIIQRHNERQKRYAKIRTLSKKGLSNREIAERIAMSPENIARILKKIREEAQ